MPTNPVMKTTNRENKRSDASGGMFAAKGPGISLSRDAVTAFCLKWGVSELALFGSVLREDFRPESDVDVLVRFKDQVRPTLFDMVRMQNELEGIIGRKVDLVSRRAVEKSRNDFRRNAILQSAEVIYGS